MVATGLREVAAGDDAEFRAERLQENRHQIRDEDDAEQPVTKCRPARQIRRPVARIHVADRHQVTRPGESQHLSPKTQSPRHRDGAVDLRKAWRAARQTPAVATVFKIFRTHSSRCMKWTTGRGTATRAALRIVLRNMRARGERFSLEPFNGLHGWPAYFRRRRT